MALNTANLNRTASGCAWGEVRHGVFHYKTDDAAAAVETNGYFDDAADHFTEGVGDIIHCVLDADGTPALKTYLVTRAAGDIALTAAAA